jgi:hypothetical protein
VCTVINVTGVDRRWETGKKLLEGDEMDKRGLFKPFYHNF